MKKAYKCKFCDTVNEIGFFKWFFAPHIGNTRCIKCKECGKKAYMRSE